MAVKKKAKKRKIRSSSKVKKRVSVKVRKKINKRPKLKKPEKRLPQNVKEHIEREELTPNVKEIIPAKKNMQDVNIETKPDMLYRMVNLRGKVSVAESAKIFGVVEKQIESWALVLEEHKLIKIHYPAFGKPVLFSLEYSNKSLKKRQKEDKEMQRISKAPPSKQEQELERMQKTMMKKDKSRRKVGLIFFLVAAALITFLVLYLVDPALIENTFLSPNIISLSQSSGNPIPSILLFGFSINLLPFILIIVAIILIIHALKRKRKK